MTDSASQSLVDRGWTPEQFWEYLEAFVGDWETKTIRTMMTDHGLSLAPAARITELEAERGRLASELDASNNNHRAMAHQMAELGARCLAAESEVSSIKQELAESRSRWLSFRECQCEHPIMLIRLTHADASARTMGIPEQSRSAPLEG